MEDRKLSEALARPYASWFDSTVTCPEVTLSCHANYSLSLLTKISRKFSVRKRKMLLSSRSVMHHSAVYAGGLTSAWRGRSLPCSCFGRLARCGVVLSSSPCFTLFQYCTVLLPHLHVFKHVEVLHCSDFGPLPVLEVTVCQGPVSTLPTGRHAVI